MRVRQVELARRIELLAPLGHVGGHVSEHRLELGVVEHPEIAHVHELAVLAHDRRLAHLEVDVACAEADGA